MVDSISVKDAAGATVVLQTVEKAVGDLKAMLAPATAGANSSVAASASSVSLLASNASRKGAVIVNDSTVALKIALGFTASATAFSSELGPGASTTIGNYSGAINGIWASATGNARVTELT